MKTLARSRRILRSRHVRCRSRGIAGSKRSCSKLQRASLEAHDEGQYRVSNRWPVTLTREQARILLYRAIGGRADHAALVSITVRQRHGRVMLTWRDYLTREEGPLAVIPDSEIEASVSHLVAALQQWRANALPPKKPAQSCSGVKPLVRAAAG